MNANIIANIIYAIFIILASSLIIYLIYHDSLVSHNMKLFLITLIVIYNIFIFFTALYEHF